MMNTPQHEMIAHYEDVDDVALHDIAVQSGLVLQATLEARADQADEDAERDFWDQRARLVARQRAALRDGARMTWIAQMAAWHEEMDAVSAAPDHHAA